MFGSWCAIARTVVCLAAAFSGCLNPLTDDQPSARPAVVGDDGAASAPPPASQPGASPSPGDSLIDEDEEQGTPAGSGSSAQPGDAGVVELDAGPDSGTSGR